MPRSHTWAARACSVQGSARTSRCCSPARDRSGVSGVALLDGAGLSGGGEAYDSTRPTELPPVQRAETSHELQAASHTDPVALFCLRSDPRPDDYAPRFAAAARRVLLLDADAAMPRWWRAVARVPGVRCVQGDRAAAARALAG